MVSQGETNPVGRVASLIRDTQTMDWFGVVHPASTFQTMFLDVVSRQCCMDLEAAETLASELDVIATELGGDVPALMRAFLAKLVVATGGGMGTIIRVEKIVMHLTAVMGFRPPSPPPAAVPAVTATQAALPSLQAVASYTGAASECLSFRIDSDDDGDDMAHAEADFFPEYDTIEKAAGSTPGNEPILGGDVKDEADGGSASSLDVDVDDFKIQPPSSIELRTSA